MIGAPETDTKNIARDVLTALIRAGRRPADEEVSIQVCAQRPISGETGKALVEVYGCAYYHYTNDQLTFEKW